MRDYARYPTCCMGPLMSKGLGASPMHPPPNLALQSSPTSTVTLPAVHDYILLHQDHSAKSNEQIPSDYYLF